MITANEIDKRMVAFYSGVKNSLPQIPPAKPFLVTIVESKTDSVPFSSPVEVPPIDEETPQALGVPKATLTSIDPNEGPTRGGQSVTITGTGFISGAKVYFNLSEATNVVVVDDKKITCVTPAQAQGKPSIKVQNVANDPNSGSSVFNLYTYVAPPTITQVSTAFGPTAGGTAVAISGLHLAYVTTVNWGGANIPFSYDGVSKLNVTAPSHSAGFITITLTNKFSDTGGAANAYKYLAPPDSYQWFTASGFTPTATGFDNGGVKRFQIVAITSGVHNAEYQGNVNVSTLLVGPAVSFNDNPNYDYPIPVVNGIAVFDVQAFCIDHGASTVQSLQFRARDAQFTSVIGDSPIYGVSNLPDLAVGGRRTGGGGGGGVNNIGWSMGYAEAFGPGGSVTFSPWNWEGVTLRTREVKILMRNAGGFVIDYNGFATLEHVYITQPTSSNGFNVSHSATVNFVHGEATTYVTAAYTGSSNNQSYAYFYLKATGNSVTGQSPQCSILNHL